MTKHTALIRESLLKTEPRSFQGNEWGARHVQAWDRNTMGIPYMISGLAQYADAYRRESDTGIGEDYVLGPAWESALRGVRALLNGTTGGLDCGAVDSLVCAMLEAEGFQT